MTGPENEEPRGARRCAPGGTRVAPVGLRTAYCQPPAGKDGLGQSYRGELKVVNLIAQGATNRAVADQLYLSLHSVKTHVHNAFTKLGISSRAQLVRVMH